MDNIQRIGTLKYWNRDRAFGVLTAPNEFNVYTDYFVHISNCIGNPDVGCRVEFIVGGKTKGALLPALRVKFFPKITPALVATLTVAAQQ